MFAVECAAQLTGRLNLLCEPVGPNDLSAVAMGLDRPDAFRCPGTPTDALPAAVDTIMRDARGLRSDELLAVWAKAREDAWRHPTAAQQAWLAQLMRCLLPRRALEALLGIDRDHALALSGCGEVVAATRREQSAGLSENHLHSGAADELGDLLARLVPRVADATQPRKLSQLVGVDPTTKPNLAPLVLALAAVCTLLDIPAGRRSKLAPQLIDVDWWKGVRAAVQAGEDIDAGAFTDLRWPVQEIAGRRGRNPQLEVLYDTLECIVRGRHVEPVAVEAARRGLISLSLLYRYVAIPHTSNLGSFRSYFDVLRHLRGLFGYDTGRLTSALRTMHDNSSVTAVELRKSIKPSSEHTVSVARLVSLIRWDVVEHARAAADACEILQRPDLVVRMPVTFTRRDAPPVDLAAKPAGYAAFRPPVAETLALADAIVQATQDEVYRRFVGAVDVVGDEKRVPNWLYALAYGRIAQAPPGELEFACHAGEYFADPLEGLRRIAEVAQFRPALVRRIGHCLALEVASGAASSWNDEAGTLLENVAWSLLVLEGRQEAAIGQPAPSRVTNRLLADLRRASRAIAACVFGCRSVSAAEVCRWYALRFDASAMAVWLPGLDSPPGTTKTWSRGFEQDLLPRPKTRLDAMLATTVYVREVDVRTSLGIERVGYDPEARLPPSLVEEVRDLLVVAGEHVREPVRRWLNLSGIVIECCPSSNAALAKLALAEHPIWMFHNVHRLHCSVNTDDPTLFGASLSEEYVHAGMVAHGNGGDGAAFVAELAAVSRRQGMIERPLCNAPTRPIDVYRQLASIV